MQPYKASVYDRHGRREVLTGAGETNYPSFRPSCLPAPGFDCTARRYVLV